MSAIGFNIAADARHPFGTENACVFFKDGTYLEPLAVWDRNVVVDALRQGNQFVARNNAYRFLFGEEGLSAVAMGTGDADRDHAEFARQGLVAGDMLTFSRPMRFPDGSEAIASFKLAFANDFRSPGFFGFTCQRINVPAADRSALEQHDNGVTGLRGIVLSEPSPDDFFGYLSSIIGEPSMIGTPDGAVIRAANAEISILTPTAFGDLFGETMVASERGLRGRAVVFTVADLARTTDLLQERQIDCHTRDGMIVVPHRPGQATTFAFVE
jgi:hypothetical protein